MPHHRSHSSTVSAVARLCQQESFCEHLLTWHQKHRQLTPWRQLYAQHQDPYVIWVSEIMLQQTTTQAVIPKFLKFIEAFPTLKDLAQASTQKVRSMVSGLGYYRRFELMHRAAHALMQSERSLPKSYQELLKLPGIGPYTAAAIASICHQEVVPVCDGNVIRVVSRMLDLRLPKDDPAVEKIIMPFLKKIISQHHPGDFNEALMDLGQMVCVPKSRPHCTQCPGSSVCLAHKRHTQALSPAKALKTPTIVPLICAVYVVPYKNTILTMIRPQDLPFLKNTPGLPLAILPSPAPDQDKNSDTQQTPPPNAIGSFSHSITRYKITAHVVLHSHHEHPHWHPSSWTPTDAVTSLFLSSLDHKAWRIYCQFLEQQTQKTSTSLSSPPRTSQDNAEGSSSSKAT